MSLGPAEDEGPVVHCRRPSGAQERGKELIWEVYSIAGDVNHQGKITGLQKSNGNGWTALRMERWEKGRYA